jgi:thiamine-monophosphate kinase
MSLTIGSLGERALVDRLRARVGAPPAGVLIGIGDDAAVLEREKGMVTVVTTDSLVETVHFRRDWTPASSIGHKALAVNLSDLAAMGARPSASLLSLALPDDFPVADFDDLINGFATLASESGAALVGGNLARSPGPVVVDVTAIGMAAPRRLLRRDTARVGDEIFVTGTIGAAAAGLLLLATGRRRDELDDIERACVERHERPSARTRMGLLVGRARAASAAIDLSDGLADAARRLAEGAGGGVVLDAAALPVHDGVRQLASKTDVDATALAVTGGEDYELAFAVAPRRRRRFLGAAGRCRELPVSCVGRIVEQPGAWLETAGQLVPLPEGFRHF